MAERSRDIQTDRRTERERKERTVEGGMGGHSP